MVHDELDGSARLSNSGMSAVTNLSQNAAKKTAGTCLGVPAHVLDAADGLQEVRHTLVLPQRDLQPRGVAVLDDAHLQVGEGLQARCEAETELPAGQPS